MDKKHQERHDSGPALYLIAHKVRGEPAFDIAQKIRCPICEPQRQGLDPDERGLIHCHECDEGFWFIIPTSGHRAYPYREFPLTDLEGDVGQGMFEGLRHEMPADLPDHYVSGPAPGQPTLAERLGIKRKALPQVTRRI